MGEIADMMLSGLLCERCGVFMGGDEPGHPVVCEDCKREAAPKRKRRRKQSANG
jgi:hypothetical protein